MTLPEWLDAYAALDDDALAVLANRGLARRAAKEAGRFDVESADAAAVELRYTGTPSATVRLLPGGPRKATCGCPVAGVCVHIVAACVWARAHPPVEPVETSHEGGFDERNQPGRREILDELLALEPAAVNRAAGIAAVRKVAAGVAATPTTVEPRGGTLRIAWPGSPEIVAVTGGGVAGMLVAGGHGDVAERAWRLEAMVRLFAANDRAWEWPAGIDSPDVIHPGQREAMVQARNAAETLLRAGLSRVGPDGVARLAAAAQRARLEALPLLATLLTQARGRAAGVAGRDDDSSERQLLAALARSWALATALQAAPAPLPAQLVGGRGAGEAAEVGTLLPLALRWWTAPSGARGLTAMLWDLTHQRLETVTAGRAAGADPSFTRSWDAPLLWGVSANTLAGGRFTLAGAERRDDGSLSPTTRSRVVLGARFGEDPPDLEALARTIEGSGRGADAIGFLPRAADVRIIVPRRLLGVAEPELDEVNQELRWPITDRAGVRHLARMDATGPDEEVIGGLLRDGRQIAAVVLDDRDRPVSVFVVENGRHRLISPSLTPAEPDPRRRWLIRKPADRRPRAHAGEPTRSAGPLAQACEAVLDVCEALASTGRPTLSARQRDTLRRRADEASGLGLGSLADAVNGLLAEQVTASAVLRASLVAGRVLVLAALD